MLPHRPDAYFTLYFPSETDNGRTIHFFYEADRYKTNTTKFNRKLQAHHHFIKQQLHKEKYGLERVDVVLVETADNSWATTLRSAAHHPVASGREPEQW